MDGPCRPHPSGHSDLYPCWLARRKTLKSPPVTKPCHDLRVCEPVHTGPCNPLCARLQKVGGASHSQRAAVEPMGVDHRRPNVAVAEQLLNRADGLAPLQQMRLTNRPQASVAEPLLHLDDPERMWMSATVWGSASSEWWGGCSMATASRSCCKAATG